MATPEQFANRLRRIALGVVDGAARSVRNSGLAAVREVVKATPKLSTLARSNWVASVGAPDLSERPIRAAADVIDEARGALNLETIKREIFSNNVVEIHIANGGDKVPYLGKLNRGTSKQAPAGFARMALDAGAKKPLGKARLLRGTRGTQAVGV